MALQIFEAIKDISVRIVAVSKSKPELLSTAVAKAKFKLYQLPKVFKVFTSFLTG